METVTILPSDDVWVYPHSSDPARDETLRMWGAGGRSVAADAADAEDFAYGYLRFAIPARFKGARLTGATLELTNVPNDELDEDAMRANPLEARPLTGTFAEKTWTYTDVAKVFPALKAIYGRGSASPTKGQPIRITIDLLTPDKEKLAPTEFAKTFAAAFTTSGDGEIGIALTSGVDVASVGMRAIYKVYSKETSDETRRPRLVLLFGDSR